MYVWHWIKNPHKSSEFFISGNGVNHVWVVATQRKHATPKIIYKEDIIALFLEKKTSQWRNVITVNSVHVFVTHVVRWEGTNIWGISGGFSSQKYCVLRPLPELLFPLCLASSFPGLVGGWPGFICRHGFCLGWSSDLLYECGFFIAGPLLPLPATLRADKKNKNTLCDKWELP